MRQWIILALLMPISLALMAQVSDKKTYVQFKVGQSHLADSHHTRAAQGASNPALDVVTRRDGNNPIYYFSTGYYYRDNISVGVDFLHGTYRLKDRLQVIKGGVLSSTPGALDGLSIPISNAKFDISAALISVDYIFDKYNLMDWRAYVGAGIGYAKLGLSVDDVTGANLVNDSDNVLTYTLRSGVNYTLDNDKILNFEYSYLSSDRADYTGTTSGLTFQSEFETHSINMGVKFLF